MFTTICAGTYIEFGLVWSGKASAGSRVSPLHATGKLEKTHHETFSGSISTFPGTSYVFMSTEYVHFWFLHLSGLVRRILLQGRCVRWNANHGGNPDGKSENELYVLDSLFQFKGLHVPHFLTFACPGDKLRIAASKTRRDQTLYIKSSFDL